MIGVVVVTHGQLATELLNAAETIVGDLPQFAAVSIGWHEDTEDARAEIAQAIARVRQDDGVLILSDMFGGTPSNLAMTFLSDTVEVITGVNLPMLIKLADAGQRADLLTAAREIREQGRAAIWVASDLLRGEKTTEKA
ncbi:MAG: PTS fructose transporter subunit IIA [Acidobacteria bacterium]|nr:MAG: PTS fructose transporter subunit IIA [Acidobacteriota bacterium]PYR82453.1 MAG: PTS fructose transporter subunit IIA [Acidobacteriota bacterium]